MLELENISKTYAYKLIFKHVNLKLEPASINLLIGENGSGKSTLFKIIVGLIAADSGTVKHSLALTEIAYLAHSSALYFQLSARENLKFWSGYQGLKHSSQEIDSLLKRVNLFKYADELVSTFSRGMLQRLSLARILLQDAKLILLDEPATGLDLASRQLLEDVLLERQKKAAIFWISHDLDKDRHLADKIYQFKQKTLELL